MQWFFPDDKTAPVIQAGPHIQSKYPGMDMPTLPERAVVFCLGRGLPQLQQDYPTQLLMEKLAGFITHSPVVQVEGHPGVCFVHGGYGAPQAVCTVESLHALGVKELLLVGLCGAFAPGVEVGQVLLPPQIWSEEGASLHYRQEQGFVQVPSPRLEEAAALLEGAGLPVKVLPTATTDAVYRQTFRKEALWRELGCAAVDMEASAVATVCGCYGMACTVALLVSDKHPMAEGEPAWKWGGGSFAQQQEAFIRACVRLGLGENG